MDQLRKAKPESEVKPGRKRGPWTHRSHAVSRSRGQRAFNLISCPRLARTRIIIHCPRLGTRAVLSVLPLLLPLRSPNTMTRRGRPFRRISYRLPRGRRRWGPGGIAAARACRIDRIQTVGSGPSRGQASRGVVVQSEWGRCTHGAWARAVGGRARA